MATRKSGSLGWFVIGILVGIVAVAGVYFYATRDRAALAPTVAEPALPLPPSAGPPPIAGAPSGVTAAPVAPPPKAAAPAKGAGEPTDQERQIADDAAATGMTGPVNPPADQPTN